MIYLGYGPQGVALARQHPDSPALAISYNQLSVTQERSRPVAYQRTFPALLGLQKVAGRAFLAVAEEVEQVGSTGMSAVNEIKRVGWLPLAPQSRHEQWLAEAREQIERLQLIFAHGLHYYCDEQDLSLPLTLREQPSTPPSSRFYYDQFVWNHNLIGMDGLADRPQRALLSKYCPAVIQGYFATFSLLLPSRHSLRYCLVSRRSTRHAGTRFHARGITESGAVANYTETEQIAYLADRVFTHLQIRGSVPVFFSQNGVNGITSDLQIGKDQAQTSPAFSSHFETIREMYGRTLSINLLCAGKEEEKKLSLFYEQMVERERLPQLRYHYYDFHKECKGDRFDKSQELIEALGAVSGAFGYSCLREKAVERRQNGVFRTNCLDCLDRTNYVQSRLALAALTHWLRLQPQSAGAVEEGVLEMPVKEECRLLGLFNEAWADNGDAISLHYTDVQSTHTDITRTGERTLGGAVGHKMRSLRRFFTQFTDETKHAAIQAFLTPTHRPS